MQIDQVYYVVPVTVSIFSFRTKFFVLNHWTVACFQFFYYLSSTLYATDPNLLEFWGLDWNGEDNGLKQLSGPKMFSTLVQIYPKFNFSCVSNSHFYNIEFVVLSVFQLEFKKLYLGISAPVSIFVNSIQISSSYFRSWERDKGVATVNMESSLCHTGALQAHLKLVINLTNSWHVKVGRLKSQKIKISLHGGPSPLYFLNKTSTE